MKPYEKQWQKIVEHKDYGRTDDALKAIESLENSVQADNKSLGKSAYLLRLEIEKLTIKLSKEDNASILIINALEDLSKQKTGVEQNIIYALIADAYANYVRNNIWTLRDRTNVDTNVELADKATWDIQRWMNGIMKYHELSLQGAAIKNAKTIEYVTLLESVLFEDNSYAYEVQSSLYDILIAKTLNFYASEHNYLTKPAERFYLDSEKALANQAEFLAWDFKTTDTFSNQYKAIKLYQSWLKFNQEKGNTVAMVHADLMRLNYALDKSILENKTALYEKSFEALRNKYKGTVSGYYLDYNWVKYILNRPIAAGKENTNKKEAYDLIESLLAASNLPIFLKAPLQGVKNEVLNKSFTLQLEGAIAVNKAALVRVDYTNVNKLYYRIILVTPAMESAIAKASEYDSKLSYEERNKRIWQVYTSQKAEKTGSWNLADKKDYNTHSTEVFFEGLKQGKYSLLVSYDEDFKVVDKNALSYNNFVVSNLHYLISTSNHYYTKGGYVIDRNSGKPLENVTVEIWSIDRGKNKKPSKISTLKTDKNGAFAFSTANFVVNDYYDRYCNLIFINGKDTLHSFSSISYNEERAYPPNIKTQYHIFTDRAIYRPGQTLYFKGIALEAVDAKQKAHKVVANQKVTVVLRDANYQVQETLKLTTNEFGSFAASFTLPASGMTGNMSIQVNGQVTKYVQVEEYKRPQFYVEMLPIKVVYKLDDQVKVQGKALAYAGNTLSDATVKYRVERKASFPYWSWRWGYNPYSTAAQEITSGEVKSNDKGEFEFDFKAIADKAIPLSNKPEFNYTIYVDVVDITGETHSAQTIVTIGTIAQKITLNIAESLDKNKAQKINIDAKNLNGQYEASVGKIKIIALQSPNKVYSKRIWEKPELQSISAADFEKYFPEFAYNKEDEPQHWAEKSTVFEDNYNTETSKEITLPLSTWAAGKYRIILTSKDKFGQDITVEKDIEIYDSKATIVPLYKNIYTQQASFTVGVDSTVNLTIGTPKEAYVLAIAEIDKVIVFKEWVKISELHTIPFKVKEAHRDRLEFKFYTFYNNRFYTQNILINIPYTDKELKIELLTFRDKLLPGQKEEWKIKVSGSKSEKIMAELLAGMYDASLDAFVANNWSLPKPSSNYSSLLISTPNIYGQTSSWEGSKFNSMGGSDINIEYSDLVNITGYNNVLSVRAYSSQPRGAMLKSNEDFDIRMSGSRLKDTEGMAFESNGASMMDEKLSLQDAEGSVPPPPLSESPAPQTETKNPDVQIRTNLKETVFFYPQVQSDAEGNFVLSFTMNEALTKWKLMLLAHTKDLAWSTEERTVVTQKELMVQPNAPRFFRQGDTIHFVSKISNLTDNASNGQVTLQLFDALSMRSIDAIFGNNNASQNFSIEAQNNTVAVWKLIVPEDFTSAITYRVIAKAGAMSDGEENALPVVSNRMLITETMPLPIRGGQSKKFDFKRMSEVSKKSTTLRNHAFTLEFTQNPAWYAVQALPYLMEYPYECSEQIFSRYYANALATSVANSTPKIKQVFEQWKNVDTAALKSNLHKNQELKYALLEETPWVLAAESEAQQKRNIGLLFDLNKMSNELALAKDKLLQRQLSNGGFPWFAGGKDDWYITQYIAQGMAHLQVMKVVEKDERMQEALKNAVSYIDAELVKYYREYIYPKKAKERNENNLSAIAIHYLYTRSFYLKEMPLDKETKEVVEYFVNQAKKYWGKQSIYNKGMLALYAHRTGDKTLATEIVKSIKQQAINNEEMGMYWKGNAGYYWYEMPIETHTLMIELFDEVANDQVAVEDLKTWLLKNKQTTHWKTTKATAGAVYALLSRGVNLIEEDKPIDIKIGGKQLDLSTIKQEAGTGYFKQRWEKENFDNSFANIEVKNNNKVVAWGAAYWQYFEDLDKVTSFEETPLKINKEVFVQKNTATGPMLTPMKDGSKVNVGDLIKIRIEIRVDRAMEYVHLKDMRAAGLEPVNTLSGYKYKGGLGYYENTRDMASNFFISYLSKGTYVFEYELRATYKGNYSNGVTTMQCMYAPEFTSHSKGIRLTIE